MICFYFFWIKNNKKMVGDELSSNIWFPEHLKVYNQTATFLTATFGVFGGSRRR